jgi:hypothetical protein
MEAGKWKAWLSFPAVIAVDVDGNLYISSDNRIHLIAAAGLISTIACKGAGGSAETQDWPPPHL